MDRRRWQEEIIWQDTITLSHCQMLFHGAEGHQRSNGQIRNLKQSWCIVFLCHCQDPLQGGICCWMMWLCSIEPTRVKLQIASVWHSLSGSLLSMSLVNTRVGFRVHICGGKSAYKVHSGGKKKQQEEKGKLYLRRKQWTASGNCHHHFPGETRSSESITHTREAAYYAAEGNSNAYVWEETQTYSLGREEPCKTIDSKRFLQQTDPKTTSVEGVSARGVGRNARGAGDGGKTVKEKEKKRWYLAGEEVAAAMLARRGGCGGGRRRGSEKESSQPPPPHLLATHALVELFPFRLSLAGCRLLLPRFLLRLLPSFSRFVSLLFSVYLFPWSTTQALIRVNWGPQFMGPRPMGPSYLFSFSFFSLALPHGHSLENRLKFKYATNL